MSKTHLILVVDYLQDSNYNTGNNWLKSEYDQYSWQVLTNQAIVQE